MSKFSTILTITYRAYHYHLRQLAEVRGSLHTALIQYTHMQTLKHPSLYAHMQKTHKISLSLSLFLSLSVCVCVCVCSSLFIGQTPEWILHQLTAVQLFSHVTCHGVTVEPS